MAGETIRILIACDAAGEPIVLRTDSLFVKRDIEEVGTTSAQELCICTAKEVKHGVYLWEGTIESGGFGPEGEHRDPVYRGKLRPVRVAVDSEIAGLFCMEPPADEDDDRETTPDNR